MSAIFCYNIYIEKETYEEEIDINFWRNTNIDRMWRQSSLYKK